MPSRALASFFTSPRDTPARERDWTKPFFPNVPSTTSTFASARRLDTRHGGGGRGGGEDEVGGEGGGAPGGTAAGGAFVAVASPTSEVGDGRSAFVSATGDVVFGWVRGDAMMRPIPTATSAPMTPIATTLPR